MNDLIAARLQMAVSLGFHINFACVGMVMPFFMFVAELRWLRTGREEFYRLTKIWSRGVAILFAVGAVSGTLLSFELGLLWPKFMEHAGSIIGLPFSWEGGVFFIEAVALGLYLYGWKILNKYVHLITGLIIGLAAICSGIIVIAANGWMNSPAGFDWINGQAINIDPVKAMFNKAWFPEASHMAIASFVATGFGVAGIHAFLYLKNRKNTIHKKAINIALTFAAVAAIIIPISGDYSAKDIAKRQPEKLAAMESLFETQKGAPLVIGSIGNEETREIKYGIRIPKLLSFLAHGNFNEEVTGLDQFPKEEWPPVNITHINFQLMVLLGLIMAGMGMMFFIFSWKRKQTLEKKWWLKLLIIATPFGFLAVQAGWVVTEVGRQPWIIYRIMKTEDSVTSMPGIIYSFIVVTVIYLILTFLLFYISKKQFRLFEQQDNETI